MSSLSPKPRPTTILQCLIRQPVATRLILETSSSDSCRPSQQAEQSFRCSIRRPRHWKTARNLWCISSFHPAKRSHPVHLYPQYSLHQPAKQSAQRSGGFMSCKAPGTFGTSSSTPKPAPFSICICNKAPVQPTSVLAHSKSISDTTTDPSNPFGHLAHNKTSTAPADGFVTGKPPGTFSVPSLSGSNPSSFIIPNPKFDPLNPLGIGPYGAGDNLKEGILDRDGRRRRW
ncbi:hypothetical protein BCR34DRAFT_639142 [Clohesyomyces aquaticus]|uniref:Uncharacterized protein n=1 Tax=Clohesyomyces aquaticus TaxID=1231657 RepID=A0A1Y1YPD8_9PLEO|nr:hypothetical protein BCR34DRAFT_639142 [Clohesyomyces aquaticus]